MRVADQSRAMQHGVRRPCTVRRRERRKPEQDAGAE
jgi:hypothetical protein